MLLRGTQGRSGFNLNFAVGDRTVLITRSLGRFDSSCLSGFLGSPSRFRLCLSLGRAPGCPELPHPFGLLFTLSGAEGAAPLFLGRIGCRARGTSSATASSCTLQSFNCPIQSISFRNQKLTNFFYAHWLNRITLTRLNSSIRGKRDIYQSSFYIALSSPSLGSFLATCISTQSERSM